jgi:hypothetical protein
MKIVYAKQGETKKLKWTKRAKKIENMHKWSTTEQGIVGSQRPETSPSSTMQGRRLLSASDEQHVAV